MIEEISKSIKVCKFIEVIDIMSLRVDLYW